MKTSEMSVRHLNWIEITVHTKEEAEEPVAAILNDYGANGVVVENLAYVQNTKPGKFGEIIEIDTSRFPVEGIYVKAYFHEEADWQEKRMAIKNRLLEMKEYNLDAGSLKIAEKVVQEEDWANEWKKYFKTEQVTERLRIVPSWESDGETDDQTILIDPGMAFGTGTHPTTILSMKALEKYIQPDDIVLDVGTGSGILSITASKLGAGHVYGYDLDEVAVKSAHMNRDLNQLENKITLSKNNLLTGIQHPVQLIVANILAEIILGLVDDAWDNLREDGYFITSGIIEEKEILVKNKLIARGFDVIEVKRMDHWVTLIAKKRK